MNSQTVTYYKNATQSTRFTKETGELVHLLNHKGNMSVSVQTIEATQRDTMAIALAATNVASTSEEFNGSLATVKTSVANL